MKKSEGRIVSFKPRELTAEGRADLRALADLPDDQIDYSDIPATTAEDWVGAEVGKFYRPLKQQLTLRVDADVLDWFKRESPDGKGYQTRINTALREYMAAHTKKAG
ncbi:MAG: toxin-antitoxin system, antitoxin component [Devosia sp.]|uniref:BrnA antitoxin family protein n=1 Tax=Devosia sp. TaxID=1871048 RepID=UPI0026218B24|nr:BrnA antitoxin family protein [Devosia sp.]MDB5539619.1 toxin-antitoxin system, antitoxin component [Devosia sp.]